MKSLLGIFIGGGIGALLRYFLTSAYSRVNSSNKHIGTLLVNILGSFALGFVYSYANSSCSFMYKAVVVGVIASFTTFSSYEFDNLTLLAGQRYREYFKYSFGSCLLCFVSLYFGIILAKMF